MKQFKFFMVALFILNFATFSVKGQTQEEINAIKSEMDTIAMAKLAATESRRFNENYEIALNLAKVKKWKLSFIENGTNYSLYGVDSAGNPIYAHTLGTNYNIQTIKANALQINGNIGLGLDGSGFLVGVWDQGKVYKQHVAFNINNASRVMDGSDVLSIPSNNAHATHVASSLAANSTIFACNQQFVTGVATKASMITHDWNNTVSELASDILNYGLMFSNHSYVAPTNFLWDQTLDMAPFHSAFVANGNFFINPLVSNKNIISTGWILQTDQIVHPNWDWYQFFSKVPQPAVYTSLNNAVNQIPDGGLVSKTLTILPDISRFPTQPINHNVISADKVINLAFDISHNNVSDLRIYLVGPNNCGSVEVSTNNGASGSNYTETYVTNVGTENITQGIAPFSVTPFTFEGNIATAPQNLIGQYITIPSLPLIGCPVVGDWKVIIGDDLVNGVAGSVRTCRLGISRIFPTGNFRVRPHFVACGSVFAADIAGPTSAFCEDLGSSFSSPAACGGGMLLQQLYKDMGNSLFMKATSLKSLMIHTATDAGLQGPDYAFGYGILNLEKAAKHVMNAGLKTEIIEENLTNGATFTYLVESDGITPLKATLSWIEPMQSAGLLVNDMDIIIQSPNSAIEYPWKIVSSDINVPAVKGINNVDEVEQVEITSPQLGAVYTIVVSHKNQLSNGTSPASSRPFSLVISGLNTCGINDPVDLFMVNPVPQYTFSLEHASNSITASNVLSPLSVAKYVGGNEVLMTTGFDALNLSTYDALIGECKKAALKSGKQYKPIQRDVRYDLNEVMNDRIDEYAVQVSPNPSNGIYEVKTSNVQGGEFTILDSKGTIIRNLNFSSNEFKFDISNESNGLYYLQVKNERGVATKKLVLVH